MTPEQAYRAMARIRQFEEMCLELKSGGEIPGSIHLAVGQEAIPVGACSQLGPDDAVTATYRGHGWALARGVDLAQAFAEIMGRESTLSGGRGGSPYFSDASVNFMGENSIVGGGVPIALGAAVDAWQGDREVVSVVSIGDGALNQGNTHEALNFAAAFDLPLVVVVENNIYSEMTPWKDMMGIDSLQERAAGYGIRSVQIDGNDAFAVATAVGDARDRGLKGGGPTFVEAETERLVGHYSGDAQAYRPPGEVEDARTREPLVALRGSHPDLVNSFDAIDAEVSVDIDAAVTAARAMNEPAPSTLTEHLYV
ncbi:MAG: thiamine pyrophosphate-dependent dehydrogenase E1 component subunit alpha [Acidimicrobiia bacterium]|nr:thiamine pyrophosphate-dependent dehydrogenase E1 component subunit alpha [Acidimicrobiia bacterium]